MVSKDTSLIELYNMSCSTANTIVQVGESFRVKDLFRGVEWNRIPKGLRTKLGTMFFSYVNGEARDVFEPTGKTPQNQQIYIRRA